MGGVEWCACAKIGGEVGGLASESLGVGVSGIK